MFKISTMKRCNIKHIVSCFGSLVCGVPVSANKITPHSVFDPWRPPTKTDWLIMSKSSPADFDRCWPSADTAVASIILYSHTRKSLNPIRVTSLDGLSRWRSSHVCRLTVDTYHPTTVTESLLYQRLVTIYKCMYTVHSVLPMDVINL